MPTVAQALRDIASHPGRALLSRWNWKVAVSSGVYRVPVFFAGSVSQGWEAATWAGVAEFLYRFGTAGISGGLTQALRKATPRWLAASIILCGLPVALNGGEWLLHRTLGTPHLNRSAAVSLGMTALATLFNWHVMSRGAFLTGHEQTPFLRDVSRLPALCWSFVIWLPCRVYALVRGEE